MGSQSETGSHSKEKSKGTTTRGYHPRREKRE